MAKETRIGTVIHFYGKIKVAIVKLAAPLKIGDTVTFRRGEKAFSQKITSMQFDHADIDTGDKGQEVGVKVKAKTVEGAEVLAGDATAPKKAPIKKPAKKRVTSRKPKKPARGKNVKKAKTGKKKAARRPKRKR
jgi:translation elongation factor EF-1alpha